jgi:hypothetical protein
LLSTVLLLAHLHPCFQESLCESEHTVKDELVNRILASKSPISGFNGIVESAATFSKVLSIDGKEVNVTLTRFDIISNGTKFMKIRAICTLESYTFILETPNILLEQNETTQTSNEALSVKTLASIQPLSNDNPVRYDWNGIKFISTHSRPLYVKYDHPDNGPYNPPTYDIPVDEAEPTQFKTQSGTLIRHIPKHSIDKLEQNFAFELAAVLTPLLAYLFGLPELVGSKVAGIIVAIIIAILTALGWAYNVWVNDVVRTEMGDGWLYMWGAGSWWVFSWCWSSFGAWRDNGFFLMWIGPDDADYVIGDVNGDKRVDSVDLGMVYSALGSWHPACDLNFDGKVNYADLGLEFGYYLGWQTRHYTYAPPIETTATTFGQTINIIARKYP